MSRTRSTQYMRNKSNQNTRHALREFDSIEKESVRQAARRRGEHSYKKMTPYLRKEEDFRY